MSAGNLLVLQAGGPTPVINSSLYGVIEAARDRSDGSRLFGCRVGLQGLFRGDFVDLGGLSATQLQGLRRSPGSALGSSRQKPTDADLEQAVEHLRRFDIHGVLLIGGNGTMQAAQAITDFCRQAGHELRTVGIPKTIDNDIRETDRCPGFASAARFAAQSTRDLAMDIRSLPQPVSILETLGRDVGWIAAASVLGKRSEQDAPHIVCLPEVPFVMGEFLAAVDRVLQRQPWAVVVVSEGIRDAAGRPVFEISDATQTDALKRPMPGGVSRFLAEAVTRNLKVRCRDEKPGLLGRASMAHVSVQDQKDAELAGREGYRAIARGDDAVMVALMPLGEDPTGYKLVPLERVSTRNRPFPQEWLVQGDVPIADTFAKYARPLVGDLLEYEDLFSRAEVYENA